MSSITHKAGPSASLLASDLVQAMGQADFAKDHSILGDTLGLVHSYTLGAGTDEKTVIETLRKITSKKEMLDVEAAFLRQTGVRLDTALKEDLSGADLGMTLGLWESCNKGLGGLERDQYAQSSSRQEAKIQKEKNTEATWNLLYGATGAVTSLAVATSVLGTAPISVPLLAEAILLGTALGFASEAGVMTACDHFFRDKQTSAEDYIQAAKTTFTTSLGAGIGGVVYSRAGSLVSRQVIDEVVARYGSAIVTNQLIGVTNTAVMEQRMSSGKELLLWSAFGTVTGTVRPLLGSSQAIHLGFGMTQETGEEIAEIILITDRDGDGRADGTISTAEMIVTLQGAFTEMGGHLGRARHGNVEKAEGKSQAELEDDAASEQNIIPVYSNEGGVWAADEEEFITGDREVNDPDSELGYNPFDFPEDQPASSLGDVEDEKSP